jgi:lyso-ornithine lipid O-acyltransferase
MRDQPEDPPATDPISSPLRAICRLFAFSLLTLAMLPVQMTAHRLDRPLARRLPLFYHRTCCRIFGFEVRTIGQIATARPALFVSNHISYMDIAIFGSILEASFIAKAEIAGWPLFGLLARLQRTVFVERVGRYVAEQKETIAGRLRVGDRLILFPEGTSDDGQRVLPFKSALFSVAAVAEDSAPLTIQPVSIAYTHLDGIPLHRAFRPQFAWYGDMEMAPHLFRMLGIGVLTAVVTFHEPISGDRFPTRKALADYCYRTVAAGVDAANSGRPALPAPADASANS